MSNNKQKKDIEEIIVGLHSAVDNIIEIHDSKE
jgi:hypothetical protein